MPPAPGERRGAAHPTSRSAPGQDGAGRGRLGARRGGPRFSTSGWAHWPRMGEALRLVRAGPVPERGLGVQGSLPLPGHPPRSHTYLGPPTATHESAPAEGWGTLVPPPSHQHPRQLPVTQGQLQHGTRPTSPPNEAANEGGSLISGGAVLPLWWLGLPPRAPSPPESQLLLCAAIALRAGHALEG